MTLMTALPSFSADLIFFRILADVKKFLIINILYLLFVFDYNIFFIFKRF